MSSNLTGVRRVSEVTREFKRNSLLDAATDLLAESSWRKISMEKIALRAGVSRQTVYNEFGSRAGLDEAFVRRAVDRFLDRFESVAAKPALSATESLEAAMLALLSATRSDPVVLAITRGDADELLALFTTRGRSVVAFATERLSNFFAWQWPWLGETEVAAIGETLVRLAISHGALAIENDPNTARAVAGLIGPSVTARRLQAQPPEAERSAG